MLRMSLDGPTAAFEMCPIKPLRQIQMVWNRLLKSQMVSLRVGGTL